MEQQRQHDIIKYVKEYCVECRVKSYVDYDAMKEHTGLFFIIEHPSSILFGVRKTIRTRLFVHEETANKDNWKSSVDRNLRYCIGVILDLYFRLLVNLQQLNYDVDALLKRRPVEANMETMERIEKEGMIPVGE